MSGETAARHSSLFDQAQSAPEQFLIVESELLVNAHFLIPNHVLLYWIRYFYHSDLVASAIDIDRPPLLFLVDHPFISSFLP